jgi:hypothetical protein
MHYSLFGVEKLVTSKVNSTLKWLLTIVNNSAIKVNPLTRLHRAVHYVQQSTYILVLQSVKHVGSKHLCIVCNNMYINHVN